MTWEGKALMGRKAKWRPLELPCAKKTENPKQITILGVRGLLMSASIKDLQDAGGRGWLLSYLHSLQHFGLCHGWLHKGEKEIKYKIFRKIL